MHLCNALQRCGSSVPVNKCLRAGRGSARGYYTQQTIHSPRRRERRLCGLFSNSFGQSRYFAIRPSVCPFVCLPVPCPLRKNGTFKATVTIRGNPTLEVELTRQSDRTANVSGRNGNEAVAGAASEAFARWLHRRYAPVELP